MCVAPYCRVCVWYRILYMPVGGALKFLAERGGGRIIVYLVIIMHLSLLCPALPSRRRVGQGWEFERQMPNPLGKLRNQLPLPTIPHPTPRDFIPFSKNCLMCYSG